MGRYFVLTGYLNVDHNIPSTLHKTRHHFDHLFSVESLLPAKKERPKELADVSNDTCLQGHGFILLFWPPFFQTMCAGTEVGALRESRS